MMCQRISYHHKISCLLDRTLDLGLIIILEFVLIAHHQVRMRHAELRSIKKKQISSRCVGSLFIQTDADVTWRARVKWLVLVSRTMLVVMADSLPQRHCR